MGHRASVAYVNEDGDVAACYSHWGGYGVELLGTITPETPFGTPTDTSVQMQAFLGALAGTIAEGVGGTAAVHAEPEIEAADIKGKVPVNPEPYWTGDSLAEWATCGAVDYLHHEATYVVYTDQDFLTRAFVPVRWLGAERTPFDESFTGKAHAHGSMIEAYTEDEWHDYGSIEYDWEAERGNGSPPGSETFELPDEDDAMSEAEFAERIQAAFGPRLPEFDRYHPTNYEL